MTDHRPRKTVTRQLLAGTDMFWTNQVWTGTMYWGARTKLWRINPPALPKRMKVNPLLNVSHKPLAMNKADWQKAVDNATTALVPITVGDTIGHPSEYVDDRLVTLHTHRSAPVDLRMYVNARYFDGMTELLGGPPTHADAKKGVAVWCDEDGRPDAILMGVCIGQWEANR